MKYVDGESYQVIVGTKGASATVVYIVDLPEHPFDISQVAGKLSCTLVKVAVREWDDSLTPWVAPGLYRGNADFGGEAAVTLEELVCEAIPSIEGKEGLNPSARAICGYSLGGLFALYVLTHSDMFCGCACLSGSVWYEGWVDYLRGIEFDGEGRFAFLSIGSKEKHAAPLILHGVQDNMEQCAAILRAKGCTVEYVVGPGNHMAHVPERFEAGLTAVDKFLASLQES